MALSFRPAYRLIAALLMLAGLAACVPHHGGHRGHGYGRSYSNHQPVFRGHHGGHHGGWGGGHQRYWR